MNHADFCVMPSVRWISMLETPFLQLQSIQNAVIHLSSPMGESSKIVPTFSENCFLQDLQNQIRRVFTNRCSFPPQRGQITLPSGKQRFTANTNARSGSEK